MEDNQPQTAAELNHWMNGHFSVFIGPPRAYFELPLSYSIMGASGERWFRRTYYTVAISSDAQSKACSAMVCGLVAVMTADLKEMLEPIVMRRSFEWNGRVLTARLAFWRDELMQRLHPALIKPEGAEATDADEFVVLLRGSR